MNNLDVLFEYVKKILAYKLFMRRKTMFNKDKKIELLSFEIKRLKEENRILKKSEPEQILSILAEREKEQLKQYKELEDLKQQYADLLGNIERMKDETVSYLNRLKKWQLFKIKVRCWMVKFRKGK